MVDKSDRILKQHACSDCGSRGTASPSIGPVAMHYLRYLARLRAENIHPGGEAASWELLEHLRLAPGLTVLDLGCGTGATMLRLASDGGMTVVGADGLPEMLAAARQRLTGATPPGPWMLVHAEASRLPFAAACFDRVYTESVLGMQTSEVARRLLKEVRRVLKPGGLYVANEAVWKAEVDPQLVSVINARCERDFGSRQASEEPWSVDDWVAVMQECGLEVRSWAKPDAREKRKSKATRVRRLGKLLSPRLVRDTLRYRDRLKSHRDDGQFIEARLFVSSRPDDSLQASRRNNG